MNSESLTKYTSSLTSAQLYSLLLLLPVSVFFLRKYAFTSDSNSTSSPSTASSSTGSGNDAEQSGTEETKSIMQPPREDLLPPKDDPYTLEELKAFDGSDPSKPVYVSIKGTVFDVSRKSDVYGRGKAYNIFAGKDGSRGLGMSSLKTEDAVPDWSVLEEKDKKTLHDWYTFFEQRYNIVGRVTDMPPSVASFVVSHANDPVSSNL
ncbi:cytochrome b5 [Dendrothele bispora CBS 962.96]|uniref:Cytochrome b5 n=1 Tax=Dendrothele bispora (strain CBS 962.96) TaxID=1314807 RepID=A0A4S8L7M8_DENBC|nr:cytochrome b5 [Dendrothele bispora CBS 962.96]